MVAILHDTIACYSSALLRADETLYTLIRVVFGGVRLQMTPRVRDVRLISDYVLCTHTHMSRMRLHSDGRTHAQLSIIVLLAAYI